VQQGRWKQAADRLLKLVHANQVDKADMTDEATRDLLRAGPTLVFAGDMTNYRRLLEETISRFAKTENPVAAEHVMKVSIVAPTDLENIKALEPFAKVVERSIQTEQSSPQTDVYMIAWRVFALSAFEYRRGNYDAAIAWGRRGLEYSDQTPTRIAMTRLVLALSYCRTGQHSTAASEMAEASSLMKEQNPGGTEKFPPSGGSTGFWHDWLHAHLLLREAEACLQGSEVGR
jgi:tetratricopeptide (TPR) repeat protein